MEERQRGAFLFLRQTRTQDKESALPGYTRPMGCQLSDENCSPWQVFCRQEARIVCSLHNAYHCRITLICVSLPPHRYGQRILDCPLQGLQGLKPSPPADQETAFWDNLLAKKEVAAAEQPVAFEVEAMVVGNKSRKSKSRARPSAPAQGILRKESNTGEELSKNPANRANS